MPNTSTTYELSLKPVTERRAPSFERLLDRARALTAASANWESGKTVGNVQTFSLKPLQGKGPRWWARVSEHQPRHGKNAFDLMHAMFTKDRFENEKEYNKDLDSAQYLKNCLWGEVWSLHYIFPAPLSPRTSTILTVTHLENISPRVLWVISLPFQIDPNDIPLSLFVEAGVTSNVCSVERLRETDGGKAEWLCASTTSPGGSIPLWLSEYYAIKRITALVPRVDEWLDKPPKERTKSSSSRGPVVLDKEPKASTSSTTPAATPGASSSIAAAASIPATSQPGSSAAAPARKQSGSKPPPKDEQAAEAPATGSTPKE